MDAARLLEMEQILDDVVIPSPPEPARVEAFRRDAGEGDVEAGLEIVVHELRWVATPQRGEETESDLIRNPAHAGAVGLRVFAPLWRRDPTDRTSTRLNSSNLVISYSVF